MVDHEAVVRVSYGVVISRLISLVSIITRRAQESGQEWWAQKRESIVISRGMTEEKVKTMQGEIQALEKER
jgi:hypothetical protein